MPLQLTCAQLLASMCNMDWGGGRYFLREWPWILETVMGLMASQTLWLGSNRRWRSPRATDNHSTNNYRESGTELGLRTQATQSASSLFSWSLYSSEREATNTSIMRILVCARTEESSVLGGENARESPGMV